MKIVAFILIIQVLLLAAKLLHFIPAPWWLVLLPAIGGLAVLGAWILIVVLAGSLIEDGRDSE